MSSTKHKEKLQKSNDLAPEEKLRVLCLHGYRQNGNTFKSKIGKLSSDMRMHEQGRTMK